MQIVLSNNEIGLKALFEKYTGSNEKQYLTMDTCIKMIIEDAKLNLEPSQVRHAFVMSKMTVSNE